MDAMLTAVFIGIGCAAYGCIYLIDALGVGPKGTVNPHSYALYYQLGIALCGFISCFIADWKMRNNRNNGKKQ